MKTIFSIDVEEWFHILETDSLSKDIADWDRYEKRIDQSVPLLFDALEKHDVKATLFFLGWVAEKYPHLVKEAHSRGHEVASHGYYHDLVYELGPEKFREDIRNSKRILEDITGAEVLGYRAPGFSLTPETNWAYPILIEEGYSYSSSIYPSKRAHGYYTEFGEDAREIIYNGESIVEFPMTVLDSPFTALSCFGGGYFRLFPSSWFKVAADFIQKKNRNLIFYIHPRDIDTEQPKMDLPVSRRFKSYVNVSNTLSKIDKVLDHLDFSNFKDLLANTDVVSLPKAVVRNTENWEETILKFDQKEIFHADLRKRAPETLIQMVHQK
jgi:polysaccharide deacetylase family protein (PEP-CTERM system associated)